MLAVYITGHGFGHATRTAEVLRVLRERAPQLPITVISAVPGRLFDAIPGGVEHRHASIDIGLVQRDALNIAEDETAVRWREFAAGWSQLVDAEASWLKDRGARLVLADIPPLAFAAAAKTSIPSIALGNFSWDWIYAHFAKRQPALQEAARTCALAQGHADLLLELPFAGDMTAFPVRESIPLLARRSRMGREGARQRLGLRPAQTVILLSFGGIGFSLDPGLLERLPEFHFLMEANGNIAKNVTGLSDDVRAAVGLQYEDVVAAADVVVTKPGYGIVSDAIGAGTRLLYTDRGDFPEYPIMVEQMPRYLACRHIERSELLAGRLRPSLEALLCESRKASPSLEGAEVAASRILERYS